MSSPHGSDRPATGGGGEFEQAINPWLRRGLAALGVIVAVVAVYSIGAEFIPRWWGNTVGNWVEHSFSRGIGYGLAFGFVCTALSVVLLIYAFQQLWTRPAAAGIAALVAVVVSLPNLMTAAIAMSSSSAALAGSMSMTVRAPGFRGATLAGSIAGAAVVIAVAAWLAWGRSRERAAGAPST